MSYLSIFAMQTPPFHARLRNRAAPSFWHDSTQCPYGQRIAPAQRQIGTGPSTQHCPCCALLNEPLRSTCAPHVGVAVVRTQAWCKAAAPHAAAQLPLT